LDSDRSLHRGFYVPIWLLEEPESFLHTDIAVKLGSLLASDEWLESIQMIISTHSPVILASSRKNESQVRWAIVESHSVALQKQVDAIDEKDIDRIGLLMGDPNFDAYFTAAQRETLVFIEDTRPLTKAKLEEAGVPVTKALDGTSAVKKYMEVFRAVPGVVPKKAYFVLDNDKGAKEFNSLLTPQRLKKTEDGLTLYELENMVFVVLLPKDKAIEDLFEEFEDEVENCARAIYTPDFKLQDSVPANLSRATGVARARGNVRNMDEAKTLLRNQQDVKDRFWLLLESNGYKIAPNYATALKTLLT
jgi:hypothetical protein